jgi:hypothetical protein
MEKTASAKHLIIHGHFYQPPRENPWTEQIERQESASPYHDWNDRIASECYLPNALSRRLDNWGRITKLVNNYEWISFNFGPSLISWIEENQHEVYEKILEADRASAKRLGGHGNAIAQGYNHIIMPLATRRDQETQIRWGLYDFMRRFGREPEGIWLPETAVNGATLEILLEFGFRFIVLSPHQALRVRPLEGVSDAKLPGAPAAKAGDTQRARTDGSSPGTADDPRAWKDVSKGSIATGFPYRCFAPGAGGKRDSARCIDIFFYDAPLSQDVSFNHLLRNGDSFADAIEAGYPRAGNNLVVIATDGEIYGHHEPFADMALSYIIEAAGPRHGFTMTNFGAYLAEHAPLFEVELKPGPNNEGTSWSCFHGVGRWKEDCGDSTGGLPGWNQKWRAPLRAGLNSLAEALAALYEHETRGFLRNPRQSRDDYIQLIEDRRPAAAKSFLADHAARELAPPEAARALGLLESQRNAQLMFTSCGWFFSDLSGIETTQILRYAARAIELTGDAARGALDKKLLGDLKRALSNVPRAGTGADIYAAARASSALSMQCLAVLYAVASHLTGGKDITEIFGYPIRPRDETLRRMDGATVKIGSVDVTSRYTLESAAYEYLLHIEGDAGFACFIRDREGDNEYREMTDRLLKLATSSSKEKLFAAAAAHFGGRAITLKDFLVEDRERILKQLARKRLEAIEERFGDIYLESRNLLRLLTEANIPAPASLLIPAQAHLTRLLVNEVERWERSLDPAGLEGIRHIVSEAAEFGVPIDKSSAAASFTELILEKLRSLGGQLDAEAACALEQFVNLSDEMGIQTNFRDIQNRAYAILETTVAPLINELGARPAGWQAKKRALTCFLSLARRFNFNTEAWEKMAEAL